MRKPGGEADLVERQLGGRAEAHGGRALPPGGGGGEGRGGFSRHAGMARCGVWASNGSGVTCAAAASRSAAVATTASATAAALARALVRTGRMEGTALFALLSVATQPKNPGEKRGLDSNTCSRQHRPARRPAAHCRAFRNSEPQSRAIHRSVRAAQGERSRLAASRLPFDHFRLFLAPSASDRSFVASTRCCPTRRCAAWAASPSAAPSRAGPSSTPPPSLQARPPTWVSQAQFERGSCESGAPAPRLERRPLQRAVSARFCSASIFVAAGAARQRRPAAGGGARLPS
jgi:hypothetical protein